MVAPVLSISPALMEFFLLQSALLVLEDGSVFHGQSIGIDGVVAGEVVFNTAMTGYQEILTDPSYCRQIITLTQPHIGNVGANSEDEEAQQIYASGLVIRDLPLLSNNWRAQLSLGEYLQSKNVVAIAELDTRRLTRLLSDKGAQNGCIMAGDSVAVDTALKAAKDFPGLLGMDLAKEVSAKSSYRWKQGCWRLSDGHQDSATKPQWRVAAYDFGVKRNILRILADLGCDVTVVPATTAAIDILSAEYDGVFLSNGPGDPEPCDYAVTTIKQLLENKMPLFGICLGHQLLSLAAGASTVKMRLGHHGANHPVQDLSNGRVMITSQNHGFAVADEDLPETLQITHRSLFDNTVQGIEHKTLPAFGFQGHPEASPGPQDIQPLFEHFIDLMQTYGRLK